MTTVGKNVKSRASLLTMALVAAPACGGGGASSSPVSPTPAGAAVTPTPTRDTTPPVFSVAFVSPDAAVAFFVFGQTLPSGVQNPTFEIVTATQSTPVVAASAGRVANILTTSFGDRNILVTPSENSVFDIAYDHVNNVQVSVGQAVTPGMQLGTVGTLNNGRGRTELQINRNDVTPVMAFCPTNYGTAGFNEAFRTAAQRLNGSTTVCTTDSVRP